MSVTFGEVVDRLNAGTGTTQRNLFKSSKALCGKEIVFLENLHTILVFSTIIGFFGLISCAVTVAYLYNLHLTIAKVPTVAWANTSGSLMLLGAGGAFILESIINKKRNRMISKDELRDYLQKEGKSAQGSIKVRKKTATVRTPLLKVFVPEECNTKTDDDDYLNRIHELESDYKLRKDPPEKSSET